MLSSASCDVAPPWHFSDELPWCVPVGVPLSLLNLFLIAHWPQIRHGSTHCPVLTLLLSLSSVFFSPLFLYVVYSTSTRLHILTPSLEVGILSSTYTISAAVVQSFIPKSKAKNSDKAPRFTACTNNQLICHVALWGQIPV